MAISTFSSVAGRVRIQTPAASQMALMIAGLRYSANIDQPSWQNFLGRHFRDKVRAPCQNLGLMAVFSQF
jgi:hypothetical protein